MFNIRIKCVDPAGRAVVGQNIYGESGPWFMHLKLEFQDIEVDAAHHRIRLKVRLPFGMTVHEDLNCIPFTQDQCRVSYRCEFGSRIGWRGAIARVLMRR